MLNVKGHSRFEGLNSLQANHAQVLRRQSLIKQKGKKEIKNITLLDEYHSS
jgi:hypothetical protein